MIYFLSCSLNLIDYNLEYQEKIERLENELKDNQNTFSELIKENRFLNKYNRKLNQANEYLISKQSTFDEKFKGINDQKVAQERENKSNLFLILLKYN